MKWPFRARERPSDLSIQNLTLAGGQSQKLEIIGRPIALWISPELTEFGGFSIFFGAQGEEIRLSPSARGVYLRIGSSIDQCTVRNANAFALGGQIIFSACEEFLMLAGAGDNFKTAEFFYANRQHLIEAQASMISSVSAGSTVSFIAPVLIMSTAGTGGVNARASRVEAGTDSGGEPFQDSGATPAKTGAWALPLSLSCFLNVTSAFDAADDLTIGMFFGHELAGAAGNNPIAPNPTTPYIALHAVFDPGRWELWSARGDGSAMTRTVLTGVRAPAVASSEWRRIRLEYVPNRFVRGYVDGILGATMANPLNLPLTTLPARKMAGVICHTGTTLTSLGVAAGRFHRLAVSNEGRA